MTPLPVRVFSCTFVCLAVLLLSPNPAAAVEPSLPQPALVADINPDGDSWPVMPAVIGDELYFIADNGKNEQWFHTSGQIAVQASDVYSTTTGLGCRNPDPTLFPIQQGDYVLFPVRLGDTCQAKEMWSTTGTAASSRLVKRFDGSILAWASIGDRAYILVNVADGTELWQSDGTSSGTTLVKDDFRFVAALPQVMDGSFYLIAGAKNSGTTQYLWQIKPSGVTQMEAVSMMNTWHVYNHALYISAGAGEVRRLAAGRDSSASFREGELSSIVRMQTVGDRLYFMELSGGGVTRKETWWRYDGATDTLERIGQWRRTAGWTRFGDSDYFAAYSLDEPEPEGSALLRLPLTSTTPLSISPAFTFTGTNGIGSIATDGSRLYLHVNPCFSDCSKPIELWVSDGSAAGTYRLVDMAQFADCPCIVAAGGRVYFNRKTPETGAELWTISQQQGDTWLYLPQIRRSQQ